MVVTRFAPSPTGYLHIGGARTALYSWLYARRHGGRFLLRIEDTDRERSTEDAVRAIFEGLRWFGLDWDEEATSQFARRGRHAEVAHALLAEGRAYHCYATPAELEAEREAARAEGRVWKYDGRWRDRDPAEAPPGVAPVVRLKAEQSGETIVEDGVQGRVTFPNDVLDDLVLLRSDGTPTYMLAVVVDDHDSFVTHVIRGDDHLANTPRQLQIYRACGWTPPAFAHVPLIHGPDGAKLSKRHGALGVEAYRDRGYLPEAMRNYLLRLGWSHGDDEIISTEQAIAWFNLESIGRSPARLDYAKLDHLNGHYLREADDDRLVGLLSPFLEAELGTAPDGATRARVRAGMAELKKRAKTLVELAKAASVYGRPRPLALEPAAAALLAEGEARAALQALASDFAALPDWTGPALEAATRARAEIAGLKLGKLAQPLRAALTGTVVSPPIFEVAAIWGRDETLARLSEATAGA